ncbi:MAG TPA: glycosyltransferase [Candidatus Dormibacteraeota bacterium]|nr:glycosyltransferase [Candidatus Dormibacteraeota bacterium]
MPQPESTRHCVLVIPAYNEERAIVHALDAVRADRLPDGFAWREWVVLDDGSGDATVEVVRDYAALHPEIPLRVCSDGARLGKTARLEQMHRALVEAGHLDDVSVGLDADSIPDRGAVSALVAPFALQPDLAMSSGLDLPGRARLGVRASVFQRNVTARLARSCGAHVPRAVGRMYAYRVGALRDFHWRDGSMGDDVQMAAWVHRERLPFLSVWEAVVRMTPAASWRDFYRQTYRARVARRTLAALGVEAPRAEEVRRLHAFLRTALTDPVGAGAYLIARAVSLGMHRLRPATFRAAWEISPSTKRPVNA